MEGQDLEKPQRVLQEGHPRQVQDKGGKEGAGDRQEAKQWTAGKPGQEKAKGTRFLNSPRERRMQQEQATLSERELDGSGTSPTT